jgi:1,4-dihydroxy-2-naphthoate octaprenyltransferase
MEIERWKTLSHQDADFLKHLDGSFSTIHRALPVRSLNVGSGSERVTFEIVPLKEIVRPTPAIIVWHMIRPRTLVLSIGPMLVTIFACWASGRAINPAVALSSFFGVLLFHIAANLFNDYGDHIEGRDRLRPSTGTRVIQNGWVAAATINRWAWGLMVAAGICGFPAVLVHLAPVMVVTVVTALVGLEFAFRHLQLKARGWSEVIAFALTGPLLSGGFAWAITGVVATDQVVLGGIFGALSLMYFHAVNFENIMSDSQAGVRTWATWSGFDASKKFFVFTAALVLAFAIAYVFWFVPAPNMSAVIIVLVSFLVGFLFVLCRRVRQLPSPLSSGLVGLRGSVLTLAWMTSLLLIAGFTVLVSSW